MINADANVMDAYSEEVTLDAEKASQEDTLEAEKVSKKVTLDTEKTSEEDTLDAVSKIGEAQRSKLLNDWMRMTP